MKAFSSIKRRNVRKKELTALLNESGWTPVDLNLSKGTSSMISTDGRLLILLDRSWGHLRIGWDYPKIRLKEDAPNGVLLLEKL